MKTQIKILLLFNLIILTFYISPAFSLKQLSNTQMKETVGQSGIDVALSQVIVFNSSESIKLINTEETDSYVKFSDITSFTTASCGTSDVDGDDVYGYITIDMGVIDSNEYLIVNADDLNINTDSAIGQINYCGTDIGSSRVDDFNISSFHFLVGAHSSGIDMEFGFSTKTDLYEYQYNDTPVSTDTGKLSVSGISLANSFTGSDDDPSTWESDGEFTIGNVASGNPAVIDISSGGSSYPNTNPHIAIRVGSIEGSLRVENINFGGNDVGQVIIDGINLTKFDVELPGRGLGHP